MLRQLVALFFCGALLFVASSAAAQEDDTARARTEFQQGVQFFQNSDFQRALDSFQEAYRLAPHASVRLNIANCYEQLGRPVEALFHYEHYLTEAERPAAAQRREIEGSIRRLRGQIGTITFQITPDGATVTIDATDQRRSPVTEPVRVTAGRHVVEVRLDGYRTETQTLEVAGGADARVSLRLARQEATASTTTTTTAVTTTTTSEPTTTEPVATHTETTTVTQITEPEPAPSSGGGASIGVPTIIAGSVTLAALIVACVTGPLALEANSAFERDVVDSNMDPITGDLTPEGIAQARIDGENHASQARTLATVTDVMLVTAIVGAGVTTALLIIDLTSGGNDDQQVAVVPVISPQTVGVSAFGRF